MFSKSTLPLRQFPFFRASPFRSAHSSMFLSSAYRFCCKGEQSSLKFPAKQSPSSKYINPGLECARVASKDQHIELVKDDREVETAGKNSTLEEIEKYIDKIKAMLVQLEDGGITVSAYDTALVALVSDSVNGGSGNSPQFPSCLEWIANNQLDDGSWGAPYHFSVSDRMVSTLACLIALKSWNLHPHKIQKGISFCMENMSNLRNEEEENMLIGFEVIFPALIQRARKLDIDVSHDSHEFLKDLDAKRNLKLSKIPKEILHTEHTTLLFSLEALEDLDMERLLKLQCSDGSMAFSPSATAHVLIHTKDPNYLRYLTDVVKKFNGGVPIMCPVDLFARNWSTDQLQRLGIARYFAAEIDQMMRYVSRYWDPKFGAYATSDTPFHDLDDTAVCFRNMRLHGYDVSPDAFLHYKLGDAFCCFPRQSSESVTTIFDLYRASQLQFPGEKVLDETKNFSYNFLRDREANNTLVDKWVILKDLPGEVKYALDIPWYANLPRLETRIYIEQYGGEEDVWIGKVLYQIKEVNNSMYLKLAKLDYDICQTQHQVEWREMLRWYKNNKLAEFGISERSLLLSYFLATANIFERERSNERIGWAKSSIMVEIVSTYMKEDFNSHEQRLSFINEFKSPKIGLHPESYDVGKKLIGIIRKTIYQLSLDSIEYQGGDILQPLLNTWEMWLRTWQDNKDVVAETGAVLLATTINLFGKRFVSQELSSHPKYQHLTKLTARICHQLHPLYYNNKVQYNGNTRSTISSNIMGMEIESDMKELLQLVLQKSDHDNIDSNIKETFLAVAKSFYYTAYCSPVTVDFHMDKVLFQRVI